MASPALKDLPKVAETLKSQLETFNTENLKNANTQEKIILPTAEGKQIFKKHPTFPQLILNNLTNLLFS